MGTKNNIKTASFSFTFVMKLITEKHKMKPNIEIQYIPDFLSEYK
jgi:hypothetical protein